MAKLKQLRPQVAMLAPAVVMKRSTGAGAADDETAFKKTARWQRLRWSVLVRDEFTCQWPGCGVTPSDTSQLVADHIVPVRIEPSRKWDEDNLQCLCKACHDGPKQAMEVATYGPVMRGMGG